MKNLLIDLRYFWIDSWLKIKSWSVKTKWFIWDRWARKDDGPLNWDSNAMLGMSNKQRIEYTMDFHRRRHIAYKRDLARE